MKNCLLCLIWVSLILSASAAGLSHTWDYFSLDYVKLAALGGNEASMQVSTTQKTPQGKQALAVSIRKLVSTSQSTQIQLQYLYFNKLKQNRQYELVFQCRADKPGSFRMVAAQGETPWTEIGGRIVNVEKEWQTVRFPFTPRQKEFGGTLHMPRIMLGAYGAETTVYFGPVVFREAPKQIPFALNPEWSLFLKASAPTDYGVLPEKIGAVSPRTVNFDGTGLNLGELAGSFKTNDAAILYNSFTSKEAGTMTAGFAADWWFELYLNGVKIYDTMKKGNRSQDFSPDDHIVELPVKEGRNLLALKVLAGSKGWQVTCGKPTGMARGVTMKAGADWRPFELPSQIVKGSILDFSDIGLHDAPAGKYGRLIVNTKGKFAFEQRPDQPVRFFGTNIYFNMNIPDKKQAEKLADLIAASGYNSVRIHHFDYILADSADPHRRKLRADSLDRMDYLFACFKKRGIYMTIDFNTLRSTTLGRSPFDLLINPADRGYFLEFAGNLLNHVNPYTGMFWKEDPALVSISALNEDSPFFYMAFGGSAPKPLPALFEKKLKENNLTPDEQERKVLLEKFIVATQKQHFPAVRDALRAITPAPQTDVNVFSSVAMVLIREELDYVDNHFYWDHPTSGPNGKLPSSIGNRSAIRESVSNGKSNFYLPSPFGARLVGKPYTITEFNFCYPNKFRAEGGALMGAYSALQDWDAIYRYGFGGNPKQLEQDQGGNGSFDSVTDVMKLYSDRLAALLFLRRDVAVSEQAASIVVPRNYLDTTGTWRMAGLGIGGVYPPELINLGFVIRIGSVIGEPTEKLNADIGFSDRPELGGGVLDLQKRFARSSTGELELDGSKGVFKLSTPRTEALVFCDKGDFSTGNLRAVNAGESASLSFSALDGKPLAASGRILGLHLTNCLDSGMRFSDRSMSVLEAHGTLPRLARRGVAEVELKLAPGTEPEVYGVDLAGRRLGRLPSTFTAGGILRFTADTFAFSTPCFVYEIIR